MIQTEICDFMLRRKLKGTFKEGPKLSLEKVSCQENVHIYRYQ